MSPSSQDAMTAQPQQAQTMKPGLVSTGEADGGVARSSADRAGRQALSRSTGQGWTPLPPGSWLGVLGGGQLGRMFCQAAQSMGYRVCVLDPDPHCIAGRVADRQLRADYLDEAALTVLGERCAAVTTEFENVPAEALEKLATLTRVAPAASAVAIAQDRVAEKAFLAASGVPVAPYRPIQSMADLDEAPDELFPGILKVARLGYDGKGQARVASRDEAREAFERWTIAAGGQAPVCVLEQRVSLASEVSVLVVRGGDGAVATYPLAGNEHRHGILAVSTVPAPVPAALADEARQAAVTIAEKLDYHGVLCVEFFVLIDGRLLANEMAPRPHNSGHWTIDAAVSSQFEQQARVMAGLPLGSTEQTWPALMLNILGNAWYLPSSVSEASAPKAAADTSVKGETTAEQAEGAKQAEAKPVAGAASSSVACASGSRGPGSSSVPVEPDWAAVLAHPGAKLHLYGKDDARMGRKMGHLTVMAPTAEAARMQAAEIGLFLAQPLVDESGA
ncbi:MAG: 5-(carboxyamino)imidazole ribonucleotide synthase [Lautropia sp.]|nr:5-(carboxyamino)imidazole ribonucleotide synthase [Lautropia sp.]